MRPALDNGKLHLVQMDTANELFYYVALDFNSATTDYVMYPVHSAKDIFVAKWFGASTFQLDPNAA